MASQASGERSVAKQQSEFESKEPPAGDAGRGCHGAEWTNLRFPVGAVGFDGDPHGPCRIHELSLLPWIDRRRSAHRIDVVAVWIAMPIRRSAPSHAVWMAAERLRREAESRRGWSVLYPPRLFRALANCGVHLHSLFVFNLLHNGGKINYLSI